MTIVKNISVPLEKYIIAILQCQETLVCCEVTTVLLRLTCCYFGCVMRSNPIQDVMTNSTIGNGYNLLEFSCGMDKKGIWGKNIAAA